LPGRGQQPARCCARRRAHQADQRDVNLRTVSEMDQGGRKSRGRASPKVLFPSSGLSRAYTPGIVPHQTGCGQIPVAASDAALQKSQIRLNRRPRHTCSCATARRRQRRRVCFRDRKLQSHEVG
jgi:hypothetical protein